MLAESVEMQVSVGTTELLQPTNTPVEGERERGRVKTKTKRRERVKTSLHGT